MMIRSFDDTVLTWKWRVICFQQIAWLRLRRHPRLREHFAARSRSMQPCSRASTWGATGLPTVPPPRTISGVSPSWATASSRTTRGALTSNARTVATAAMLTTTITTTATTTKTTCRSLQHPWVARWATFAPHWMASPFILERRRTAIRTPPRKLSSILRRRASVYCPRLLWKSGQTLAIILSATSTATWRAPATCWIRRRVSLRARPPLATPLLRRKSMPTTSRTKRLCWNKRRTSTSHSIWT